MVSRAFAVAIALAALGATANSADTASSQTRIAQFGGGSGGSGGGFSGAGSGGGSSGGSQLGGGTIPGAGNPTTAPGPTSPQLVPGAGLPTSRPPIGTLPSGPEAGAPHLSKQPVQSWHSVDLPGFRGGLEVMVPRYGPRPKAPDVSITQLKIDKTFAGSKAERTDLALKLGSTARCCPACMCGGDPTGPVGGTGGGGKGTATELAEALWNWPKLPNKNNGSFSSARDRFSFPTTVALQYAENAVVGCTGVLVSKSKILTAAHCACREPPVRAFFGDTVYEDMAKKRGAGIRASLPLHQAVAFQTADFCPRYLKQANQLGGKPHPMPGIDLALLTLNGPLPDEVVTAILPVDPLASANDPINQLYAAGFGYADEDRWGPGVKNYARLRFTARLCTKAHAPGCQPGLESIAVAHEKRRRSDSCEADSGGPLFIDHDQRMRLIGIVSRSLTTSRFCGDGGIYTSLEATAVRLWLATHLLDAK